MTQSFIIKLENSEKIDDTIESLQRIIDHKENCSDWTTLMDILCIMKQAKEQVDKENGIKKWQEDGKCMACGYRNYGMYGVCNKCHYGNDKYFKDNY